MDRIYEVNVVFGQLKARSMASDEFSAVITAVGQVWSEHTISELERGCIASMPSISSFNSVENIQEFLKEMNEMYDDDEPKWLEMTITHHDH